MDEAKPPPPFDDVDAAVETRMQVEAGTKYRSAAAIPRLPDGPHALSDTMAELFGDELTTTPRDESSPGEARRATNRAQRRARAKAKRKRNGHTR